MKLVIEIGDALYRCVKKGYLAADTFAEEIKNGTPLPEGAEILTKEAYSDLCLRASRIPCYLGGPCEYQNEDIKMPYEERKTGRWIEVDGNFLCSVCDSGYKCQPTCMGKPMFMFCPECGAKMEGAEE